MFSSFDIQLCLNHIFLTAPVVKYMITPILYESLESSERQLWHSHIFEVKSGMLIMPKHPAVQENIWKAAKATEMEKVIQLYGKTFHLWQVDRGDTLPLGTPKLMTSITDLHQLPDFWDAKVIYRDRRFRSNYEQKKEDRKDMMEPKVHPGMFGELFEIFM